MMEYLLPIEPDYNTIWYLLVLFLGFAVGSIILLIKDYNYKITYTILGVGILVIFIPSFSFVGPSQNEYDNQMQTLIETTDCSNLPAIAHERKAFKDEIVDEIVLRCLIEQDPILVAWLQGAT